MADLRQLVRRRVAALLADEVHHAIHLRCVDKGALHAGQLCAGLIERISLADQPIGPAGVEDDAGVHLRGDAEGETTGEVCLNRTGDDARRRSLRRDDGMDTYGASLLSQTGDR